MPYELDRQQLLWRKIRSVKLPVPGDEVSLAGKERGAPDRLSGRQVFRGRKANEVRATTGGLVVAGVLIALSRCDAGRARK